MEHGERPRRTFAPDSKTEQRSNLNKVLSRGKTDALFDRKEHILARLLRMSMEVQPRSEHSLARMILAEPISFNLNGPGAKVAAIATKPRASRKPLRESVNNPQRLALFRAGEVYAPNATQRCGSPVTIQYFECKALAHLHPPRQAATHAWPSGLACRHFAKVFLCTRNSILWLANPRRTYLYFFRCPREPGDDSTAPSWAPWNAIFFTT